MTKRAKKTAPPEPWEIYDVLGDEMTQRIFLDVHRGQPPTIARWSPTILTRKQYYMRVHYLTSYGLLRRGAEFEYRYTTFGRFVANQLLRTQLATRYWTELQVIDELDNSPGIPRDKKNEIIRRLLDAELLGDLGVDIESNVEKATD